MDYNSKYTGAEVEALLDKVNDGVIDATLQALRDKYSADPTALNQLCFNTETWQSFCLPTYNKIVDYTDNDGYGSMTVHFAVRNYDGSYMLKGKPLPVYSNSENGVAHIIAVITIHDGECCAYEDLITASSAEYVTSITAKGTTPLTLIAVKGDTGEVAINGEVDCYSKKDVDDKLAEIASGGTIDLDGYLTKEEAAEEYATLDMVDTALNTIKAALPSNSLLGFLDSWFASGKDYITSAEIVDYTEDTSMVRIRFTCEGYASEGAYYFVLNLEDGGNMPITTESGNTGTSEGYLVYGVFDIVVKLTYSMGIYAFSTINQKYTLELSDKITDLASLQKAYPSSTLVSMVGSYWINQLSSHTQSTTIKIMDYDSETNSVRLRFYGRVTSNIQGLAIYESSSTKYLIQFVPRTASNYHLTFDLVVPFVNGEFLPFSTLLYIVDYV